MKLGILLLFSLICCLYSTPASALALPSAPTFGSVVLQNYPPGKSTMSRDSIVQTPEKHLKIANKSLRSGVFSILFLIWMIILLGLTWSFPITLFFGILPGILLGTRALMLGIKTLKRAKINDPLSEKARRRAIAGIVLGGVFALLFFAISWAFIYIAFIFE